MLHFKPGKNRTATAPYNFVPLPEKILTWKDLTSTGSLPWESHDEVLEGTFTGEITIMARSLTPLFIRGERKRSVSGWDNRNSRLCPDPFKDSSGRPIIPGSSFRGMIRFLVEVLSFGRISPVFSDKLFFRSMSPDTIGQTYRNIMVRNGIKPGGGIFYRTSNGGRIEHRDVYQIPHAEIPGFDYQVSPNYHPNWDLIGRELTISVKDRQIRGNLVLTGSIANKKHEFLFVSPGQNPRSIHVPEEMLERFEDDDQITQWQEKAFPVGRPEGARRRKAGLLTDGEPVFYVCRQELRNAGNPDGLLFFGRAQMFRLPYEMSPAELVKDTPGIDIAEGIFGKIDRKSGKNEKAIKGRVIFEDLNCENNPNISQAMVPKILSSPKPTTFQHYLVQTSDQPKHLRTYLKENPTQIRGHKFYWHRWNQRTGFRDAIDPDSNDLVNDLSCEQPHDQNHTVIKPVSDGRYRGKIRFSNLKRFELGALLCALNLPDGCAHKIGMAKPLGLGSIKIEIEALKVLDPEKYYGLWNENGVVEKSPQEFIEKFTSVILDFAKKNKEQMVPDGQGLAKVYRLACLFKILNWEERPESPQTSYLNLDEFRAKKVLPSPFSVLGKDEPFEAKEILTNVVKNETTPVASGPSIPEPEEKKIDERLLPNKEANGVLQKDGDSWVAIFSNDARNGKILDPQKIPTSAIDGAKASFRVRGVKKSEGLTVTFIKLL